MATKINDSIFKQFLGTIDEFKTYYNERLSEESREKLKECLVFIHDKPVTNELGETVWNNDGYIFTNGYYYTCRETNLTADVLKDLIANGSTEAAGISWEIVDGKLVFTPVIKEDLIPALSSGMSVGFIKSGHTGWEAGTSIEQILNDIFSKEYWYKADFNYTNLKTVTYVEPSLSVKVDGVDADSKVIYEIGAPVTVTATMNSSTIGGTNEVKVTPKTSGVNFSTIGDLGTSLSEKTYAATYAQGTDSLSITSKNGCFGKASVSSDNKISTTGNIAANNTIAITTTHSGSKLTLSITKSSEDSITEGDDNKLYTRSNKGNLKKDANGDVLTEATDINDAPVTVEHTVATTTTVSPTGDNTNSITLTGAYKYYYVWGADACPTIPATTDFKGDLDGWTENWGSKNVYGNNVKKSLSGYIYVLKPVDSKPALSDGIGQDVSASWVKSDTTYTNKYGTTYYLFSYHDFGPTDYQNFVL